MVHLLKIDWFPQTITDSLAEKSFFLETICNMASSELGKQKNKIQDFLLFPISRSMRELQMGASKNCNYNQLLEFVSAGSSLILEKTPPLEFDK